MVGTVLQMTILKLEKFVVAQSSPADEWQDGI